MCANNVAESDLRGGGLLQGRCSTVQKASGEDAALDQCAHVKLASSSAGALFFVLRSPDLRLSRAVEG
jgi:hypothetical protein